MRFLKFPSPPESVSSPPSDNIVALNREQVNKLRPEIVSLNKLLLLFSMGSQSILIFPLDHKRSPSSSHGD